MGSTELQISVPHLHRCDRQLVVLHGHDHSVLRGGRDAQARREGGELSVPEEVKWGHQEKCHVSGCTEGAPASLSMGRGDTWQAAPARRRDGKEGKEGSQRTANGSVRPRRRRAGHPECRSGRRPQASAAPTKRYMYTAGLTAGNGLRNPQPGGMILWRTVLFLPCIGVGSCASLPPKCSTMP